jgi:hypothetical protein
LATSCHGIAEWQEFFSKNLILLMALNVAMQSERLCSKEEKRTFIKLNSKIWLFLKFEKVNVGKSR